MQERQLDIRQRQKNRQKQEYNLLCGAEDASKREKYGRLRLRKSIFRTTLLSFVSEQDGHLQRNIRKVENKNNDDPVTSGRTLK